MCHPNEKYNMDEAKKMMVNVVSWNSMAYLPNLLASFDQQESTDFTVTIVDNASNDGTLRWLQDNRPDVAVLRNFRNQGFSRAHNQAIALALSRWSDESLEQRYIMVANPDLEFSPESIRLLIAYMDAHPEVAVCGPKLLRAFMQGSAEEERRETHRSTIIDSMGLLITKARRGLDRGAGEEDKGQYDGQTHVFGLSGACVVFRASALLASKVAGEFFDEDMFAYQEDVDLAWRMRRFGFEAELVPQAVVWHHRRAVSAPKAGWLTAWLLRRKKSPFVNYLSTRNHGWVLIKNDEFVNALLHLVWWLPYEVAKFVASVLSYSQIKGQFASLMGVSTMLKKRAEIRRRAKVSGAEIRTWFV